MAFGEERTDWTLGLRGIVAREHLHATPQASSAHDVPSGVQGKGKGEGVGGNGGFKVKGSIMKRNTAASQSLRATRSRTRASEQFMERVVVCLGEDI